MVRVGPPLVDSGPSSGSMFVRLPWAANGNDASELRLNPLSLRPPKAFTGVLLARMELRTVSVPPGFAMPPPNAPPVFVSPRAPGAAALKARVTLTSTAELETTVRAPPRPSPRAAEEFKVPTVPEPPTARLNAKVEFVTLTVPDGA